MLSFVMTSIEERRIEDHRDFLFTQANILSNQLIAEFPNLIQTHTNAHYTDIVTNFSKEIGTRVMILSGEGSILIDSFNEYNSNSKLINNELDNSLQGRQSSNIYEFEEFGRVIYVAVPMANQTHVIGSILMTSSLEPIYDSLTKLLNSLFILAFVCIGLTAATSFIFVEILSGPIEKLTELVNRISYGKYDQKIDVEGNDEIKVLSNSFNSIITKLDQVDTQRKQFVANVSHELRTPLTSIKILSSSLISDEKTDPEIHKEFLKDIDMEVDRLNEIIDSLLYLVDLDKKGLELHYTKSQVNFLITKAIYLLKPQADEKNITIDFKTDEKIWASFDKSKLHQCLTNVIGNAFKYNGDFGHVSVELVNKKTTFVINVKDNGFGISEDSLPFVFDRFYRADKARTRKAGGTGLGLSIVQQIVNLHQGRVTITSVIDEGTLVSIELPKDII